MPRQYDRDLLHDPKSRPVVLLFSIEGHPCRRPAEGKGATTGSVSANDSILRPRRSHRIGHWPPRVSSGIVLDPFRGISVHVKKAPGVRLVQAYRNDPYSVPSPDRKARHCHVFTCIAAGNTYGAARGKGICANQVVTLETTCHFIWTGQRVAEGEPSLGPGAAGVFPFRLRRQAESGPFELRKHAT